MTPSTAAEAYRFVAIADRAAIVAAARRAKPGSAVEAILRAAIGQFDGDLEGSIRFLNRVLKKPLPLEQEAYVRDSLLPLLGGRGDSALMGALLAKPSTPELQPAFLASAALVAAQSGNGRAARGYAQRAERALEGIDDELIRARTENRLALVAYTGEKFDRALELAAASARRYESIGAYRLAAPALSLIGAIHHDVTSDGDLARFYAVRYTTLAQRSGERASLIHGLSNQLIIAAESADSRRFGRIRAQLISITSTRVFRERFHTVLAETLSDCWNGKFAEALGRLRLLHTAHQGVGERVLTTALEALCHYSSWNIDAAVASAAASVERVTRSTESHDRRYLRLARVVAGFVELRAGRTAQARRTLFVEDLRSGPEGALAAAIFEGQLSGDDLPVLVRGYVRAMAVAARYAEAKRPRSGLTATEMALLPLLAEGRPVTQIARDLDRKYSTVKTHVEHIGQKLGTNSRGATIRRARELGLL